MNRLHLLTRFNYYCCVYRPPVDLEVYIYSLKPTYPLKFIFCFFALSDSPCTTYFGQISHELFFACSDMNSLPSSPTQSVILFHKAPSSYSSHVLPFPWKTALSASSPTSLWIQKQHRLQYHQPSPKVLGLLKRILGPKDVCPASLAFLSLICEKEVCINRYKRRAHHRKGAFSKVLGKAKVLGLELLMFLYLPKLYLHIITLLLQLKDADIIQVKHDPELLIWL